MRPEIFTFDDWQAHNMTAAVRETKSVCVFINLTFLQ